MKLSRLTFLKMSPLAAAGGWAATTTEKPRLGDGRFSVRDYGAAGDGSTFDTRAIQAAIDAAANSGGGRVSLNGGNFLSGALRLKSNVTLHIENGATLVGSARIEDYPEQPSAYPSRSSDRYTRRSLIFAEQAENVAIVGGGAIDGQGHSPDFRRPGKMREGDRPLLLRFSECRNVRLRDVTLRNSAMWVQSYLACDGVLLDGISVASRVNRNNDGVDIDDCSNVRIVNCRFSSEDDAICLKSTSQRGCHNIVVANCTISSACNAFKLGTDSTGGFENVTFTNCAIYDTGLAGIALEAVDGGTLERVVVSNVTMNQVGCAIFLRLGNRGRGMPQPKPGRLRRVTITNIEAAGAGDVGSSITGQPGFPVEDVLIENLRIFAAGGGTAEQAAREIPEYPDRYPEYNMFVPSGWHSGSGGRPAQLPGYGLYVRHARGLTLRNVNIGVKLPDARPAVVADDATDLEVAGLRTENAARTSAVVWLHDVAGALIESCRPPENVHTCLRVDGDKSRDIYVGESRRARNFHD